jgi:hypothetical protein
MNFQAVGELRNHLAKWLRCAAHEYRMAAAGHSHLLFYRGSCHGIMPQGGSCIRKQGAIARISMARPTTRHILLAGSSALPMNPVGTWHVPHCWSLRERLFYRGGGVSNSFFITSIRLPIQMVRFRYWAPVKKAQQIGSIEHRFEEVRAIPCVAEIVIGPEVVESQRQ